MPRFCPVSHGLRSFTPKCLIHISSTLLAFFSSSPLLPLGRFLFPIFPPSSLSSLTPSFCRPPLASTITRRSSQVRNMVVITNSKLPLCWGHRGASVRPPFYTYPPLPPLSGRVLQRRNRHTTRLTLPRLFLSLHRCGHHHFGQLTPSLLAFSFRPISPRTRWHRLNLPPEQYASHPLFFSQFDAQPILPFLRARTVLRLVRAFHFIPSKKAAFLTSNPIPSFLIRFFGVSFLLIFFFFFQMCTLHQMTTSLCSTTLNLGGRLKEGKAVSTPSLIRETSNF